MTDPAAGAVPATRAGTSWATLEDVRARWADAPMDDVLLSDWLTAAHEQVSTYAPTLPDGVPVPQAYVEAECTQVRAIGQAYDRDGDVLGFADGYAVRVRPLGAEVKALLRPPTGVPRVR